MVGVAGCGVAGTGFRVAGVARWLLIRFCTKSASFSRMAAAPRVFSVDVECVAVGRGHNDRELCRFGPVSCLPHGCLQLTGLLIVQSCSGRRERDYGAASTHLSQCPCRQLSDSYYGQYALSLSLALSFSLNFS